MAKVIKEMYKVILNVVPKSKTSIADHSRQDWQQNFTDCGKWKIFIVGYTDYECNKITINGFMTSINSNRRLQSAENPRDSQD